MRFLVLIAALLFAAAPARAADEQIRLTSAMVESYIVSHDTLEALALGFAKEFGDRSETPGEDPLSTLDAYQSIEPARQKTEAAMKAAGFASLDEWIKVNTSIILAYPYLDPTAAPPDVNTEKAAALADIKADATLDDTTRAQAIAELDDQYAELARYVPLPGNVDTIRPFKSRLQPLVDPN